MARRIVPILILIILGIAFRTIWHIGPNVEFVTAATFLATYYFGKKASVIVPLAVMAISDTLIGNTNIFVFTWSAYILIGLLDYRVIGRLDRQNIVIVQTLMGIFASLFFFLWTNFGVWISDSFHMYPTTWVGLINCYFAGLPFLKLNLAGNLFFISVSFSVVEAIKKTALRKKPSWFFVPS